MLAAEAPLVVEARLTFADLARGNLEGSFDPRRTPAIGAGMVLGGIALDALLGWWILGSPLPVATVVAHGATLLLVAVAGLVLGLPLVAAVVALLALASNPHSRDPLRMTFDESEVTIATPTATTRIEWAHFLGAREAASFFLLRHTRMHAILVKKSWMTEADRARFRRLLVAKLGIRARVR